MTDGVTLIADERARQIEEEGWSLDHDDDWEHAELLFAGIAYAIPADLRAVKINALGTTVGEYFWRLSGFGSEWWKPNKDSIKDLTKAGALIAAEIDRRLRIAEDD